jgi:integrase
LTTSNVENVGAGIRREHVTDCPGKPDCKCPFTFWMPTDPTGKRTRARIHGSLDDARRAKQQAMEDAKRRKRIKHNAAAGIVAMPTLRQWFDWLMQREWSQLREVTNEARRKEFAILDAELGGLRLDQLTVPLVETWLYETIERRGNVYIVMNAFFMLRTMLTLAEKRRLVTMNAAGAVPYPTKTLKRREKRVLTPGEYEQLLDACVNLHDHTLIRCLCEAGLRRGEAMELRKRDIDFDAGFLTISRRAYILKSGVRDIDRPKNGKQRTVVINQSLANALYRLCEDKDADDLVWMRCTDRTHNEPAPHTGASLTQHVLAPESWPPEGQRPPARCPAPASRIGSFNSGGVRRQPVHRQGAAWALEARHDRDALLTASGCGNAQALRGSIRVNQLGGVRLRQRQASQLREHLRITLAPQLHERALLMSHRTQIHRTVVTQEEQVLR